MKKLKKINILVITTALIINNVLMVLTLMGKYNSNILVCLSMYPILFIPALAKKIFKIKISDSIEFMFVVFIFIAQLLGSVAHFYSLISWFDSFAHFVSGILTALFSLQLLVLFDKYNPRHKGFNVLFAIAFTLMIASFWEMFEFSADSIFGNDAQKVLTTGVTDTMKDMICALLGSILFLVVYSYDIESDKNRLKKIIYSIKK